VSRAVVWCGVVWCGVVWCGVVWCGVVWCGVVCRYPCCIVRALICHCCMRACNVSAGPCPFSAALPASGYGHHRPRCATQVGRGAISSSPLGVLSCFFLYMHLLPPSFPQQPVRS
jgi:hypothetical protein